MNLRILTTCAAAALALAACQKKAASSGLAGPNQHAEPNPESKAFLAKTAKEPGVVTLPDGLEYKIIHSGPATGMKPHLNDEVKIMYEGKLIDGTVFDSSYDRGQPAAYPLKALVKGWQEALPLMRPGDEWMLYVPPDLGYGAEGNEKIPPNSALIFRIELIDVLPGPGTVQAG
jgi:peptidylprolyl isomerase/FKBP-type peptidyl-prolyl cis-trans isomerase FklB